MVKEGKIELYRFLGCIFIMIGHYVFYVDSELSVPFTVSYQFVEFFFIVSGYFTARHFDVKWSKEIGPLYIVKYDIKKFIRFIPYTIPAILGVYALESYRYLAVDDTAGFWHNLLDIIPEMLFLSVFKSSGAHLFIMWFLSAMFIALPFLIAFFIIKNKPVKIIIGTLAPIAYYTISPDYAVQEPANQLMRAFFGMMLGGTIYYLSYFIKQKMADDPAKQKETDNPVNQKCIVKPLKWLCTIIFIAAYIAPIIAAYNNIYFSYQYIIVFSLWILLLMSDLTILSIWNSKLANFLGDISMPIFIWHITVFKYIDASHFMDNHEIIRFVFSIFIVIIISILNMYIVRLCKRLSGKYSTQSTHTN